MSELSALRLPCVPGYERDWRKIRHKGIKKPPIWSISVQFGGTEVRNRLGKHPNHEKRAYDFHRKPLNLLVAGKGFEPMTFGL